MQKLDSFKVDHMVLVPGIYVSRINYIGEQKVPLTTFDIRLVRPNFDEPVSAAAAHTIEHIGATFLLNNPAIKDRLVYFGIAGSLTCLVLMLDGKYSYSEDRAGYMRLVEIVMDMMRFIVKFNDIIPGYSPVECGNYRFHNLEEAKNIAGNFLVLYETMGTLLFEYPTPQGNPGICRASTVNYTDRLSKDAIRGYQTMNIRDASNGRVFNIPDNGIHIAPLSLSSQPVETISTVESPALQKQQQHKSSSTIPVSHALF